jgi:cyclase
MPRLVLPMPEDKSPWICLLIFAACLVSIPGNAKESLELTKLAEGVYARVVSPDGNAVANSGIIVLDHAVLVFDTHFTPEAGQALLTSIRSVTPKPVRYVVNSHSHPDHTHGNQVFSEAQLVASTAARRDILQIDLPSMNRTVSVAQSQTDKLRRDLGQETDPVQTQRLREQIKSREDYLETMSHLRIVAPSITLDDTLTIQDGRREARILFLGSGHTEGDTVLFLPSDRIAFLGDLFFNEAIPNVQDASMLQWIKTLQEVLKLDADKFVPGHGPVGSRKDVENFLDYFEELKALVEPAVSRGDSVEQASREILVPKEFSSYQFQSFFPSNVQKMFAEVKALQISLIPAEGPKKIEREKPRQ